jgi:hypothetical protein
MDTEGSLHQLLEKGLAIKRRFCIGGDSKGFCVISLKYDSMSLSPKGNSAK